MPSPPTATAVAEDVARALVEDVGDGDLTAALIDPHTRLSTRVITREGAVLCGRPWFDETFAQVDADITINWQAADGNALEAGQCICTLEGPARGILTGERTALNFLQTLSGTATTTARTVAAANHPDVRILDTRKTLPGLRLAQKYAVRCGGGHNHRVGLFDAVLIKENHIAAAGGIAQAVLRAQAGEHGALVEVEVESLDQLDEAIAAGADRAMLDNFDLATTAQAVCQAAGRIELEASGNLTGDQLAAVAATGVDCISVGALTKHVHAVDFSMRYDATEA